MRAYDVGLVLSSPTRTKSPDLSELLRSLIISRAFPPISSIVLPVPYAKKYTSVKRAADWVIVSANTLGMLRLTIKTLLNQSRDISTSRTILKRLLQKTMFKPDRHYYGQGYYRTILLTFSAFFSPILLQEKNTKSDRNFNFDIGA